MHHPLIILSLETLFFLMYWSKLPPVSICVMKMTSFISWLFHAEINWMIFLWFSFFIISISAAILTLSALGSFDSYTVFQATSLPVCWSIPLNTILYAPLPNSSCDLVKRPFGEHYATRCVLGSGWSSSESSCTCKFISCTFSACRSNFGDDGCY